MCIRDRLWTDHIDRMVDDRLVKRGRDNRPKGKRRIGRHECHGEIVLWNAVGYKQQNLINKKKKKTINSSTIGSPPAYVLHQELTLVTYRHYRCADGNYVLSIMTSSQMISKDTTHVNAKAGFSVSILCVV